MKSIPVLLILLFSITCSQAQRTHFGLKAGLNVATLDRDVSPNYESKLGFHAGGLAHIHINRTWAVQPEVMYSSQGVKVENSNPEQKLKLGYINVPVLLQYMFRNGFRLETGPQAGFLINAESEVGNVEVNVKDDFKTFDFSWGLGLGYLSTSGLGIDARYNFGLTNILENSVNDAKNRVFQVGIFYQFSDPKKK